ncbi:hypothetical protein ABZ858_30085 [Streptomyces sp. NPDC047017]
MLLVHLPNGRGTELVRDAFARQARVRHPDEQNTADRRGPKPDTGLVRGP